MQRQSRYAAWTSWGQAELAGYETVFETSDDSTMAEAGLGETVVADVRAGLQATFMTLGRRDPLPEKFYKRAQVRAARVFADPRFDDAAAWRLFPLSRGNFLRSVAIVDALQSGGSLRATWCSLAASSFSEYARSLEAAEWITLEQSRYQDAIELLLLARCFDEAEDMIKAAKPMRGRLVAERFQYAKSIAQSRESTLRNESSLMRDFANTFDLLRDPDFSDKKAYPVSSDTRLVLGALWHKYFVSENCAVTWDDAIRCVCE